MNIPATLALTSAVLGIVTALLAFGISYAPGWRELRWFALCAATGGLFTATNVPVTLGVEPSVIIVLARFSQLFGCLHVALLLKFFAAQQGRTLGRAEGLATGIGIAVALFGLVPGLLVEERLMPHTVAWLGITYADAAPTALGKGAFVYVVLCLVFMFARSILQWLRGRAGSAINTIALGVVLVATIYDTLAAAGYVNGPYVLSLALIALVLLLGGSLTSRFVANARALEASSQSLAHAHDELVARERLAAVGELAAMIAHEVRNPIAIVFNALAALRRPATKPVEQQELFAIIQEETERLRDMVAQLLDYARPRLPVFALAPFGEIVESAVEATLLEVQAPATDVVLEAQPSLAPSVFDEQLVRQAVINLVTNALQATGRRSPVRVGIGLTHDEDGAGHIEVRVADDGNGVPIDQRGRIFTPFYSTRASGTGLGLAVVKRTASLHGGSIAITTTPGGGATFTLSIPLRRDERRYPSEAHIQLRPSTASPVAKVLEKA